MKTYWEIRTPGVDKPGLMAGVVIWAVPEDECSLNTAKKCLAHFVEKYNLDPKAFEDDIGGPGKPMLLKVTIEEVT